jgi:hypothetical protein
MLSSVSGDPLIRLNRIVMRLRPRQQVWMLALLVSVVACVSPAATTRETTVAEEPPPRFAPGGPEAEEFGASLGYPKGNPVTSRGTRWQVGSFSHLDEIFRGRLIHKVSTPSRLVRVAEPRITWTLRGTNLTLDDYLARNPTTGLLIARGDQSSTSGTSTAARTGIASPHGPWPRP